MFQKFSLKAFSATLTIPLSILAASVVLWSTPAAANIDCPSPRQTWFVQGGEPDGGNGTKKNPLNSGAQITSCTQAGDNIHVVPSETPITGEIQLKENQTLLGLGGNVIQAPGSEQSLPRLSLQSGAGLQLAEHATVQNLVIEEVGAPIQPVGTALVYGQLSAGGVVLKHLKVVKTEAFTGAGAVNVDIDAAGIIDPITMQGIRISTKANTATPNINNWFKVGIRVTVAGMSGACSAQTVDLNLNDVEVENSAGSIGIFQFCATATEVAVNAHKVDVLNGVGDHFLAFNQGAMDVDLDQYNSSIEPAMRTAILQSSFSPALSAGANFGLEYFGFPSAAPSRLKVRNSVITQGIGNGIGILQFAQANPTNLILDFGCVDFDCAANGLEATPGNNAIFGNVNGSGDPLGNDFASFLTSPLGVSLIFPFPLNVDPTTPANVGDSLNLFMDTPSNVQFVGQGNYWGVNTAPQGLGTCTELGVGFGPGGLLLAQTNPGEFGNGITWNCSLWNSFTFAGFPQQPVTNYALGYNPNN